MDTRFDFAVHHFWVYHVSHVQRRIFDCFLKSIELWVLSKVLIFSQMTQMMDIIADYLEFRDFSHSRLDGSMKMTDRQEHIEAFNDDPDRFVFLLSTRAGGLGLNLMAADTG